MVTLQTWRRVKLGDLGTFRNGVNFSKDKKGEGLGLINVKDLFADSPYIKFKTLDRVDLANKKGIDNYYVQEGDLFFSRSSVKRDGVGVVSLARKANNEVVHCGFVIRFRPTSSEIYPLYLTYLLRSDYYRQVIIGISGGSAIINISQDSLGALEIDLPPLPIQRKIAAILSAYDDLIENNTRRIEILEEMARNLYREWFVNFRFPGHEQVKMVDSELGLIPEGWEVKPLSDVCSRITDGSHWSPKTVDEGYPMASVKDMHTWGLYVDQCRKISEEDYIQLVRNGCKPLKGDVLITKDGNTYLKHIFVIEKEIDLVILSSIAILRPNEQILPYLLAFYLREPTVKPRLANYVSGAAIPRVVLKDFKRFPIVLPPRKLQDKFFRLAEAMVKNCHCLLNKNAKLCQTRDLLLPKLISGEIDVENLDINTGEIAA